MGRGSEVRNVHGMGREDGHGCGMLLAMSEANLFDPRPKAKPCSPHCVPDPLPQSFVGSS